MAMQWEDVMSMKTLLALAGALAVAGAGPANADIKIGVVHSVSQRCRTDAQGSGRRKSAIDIS
jgi:hypothetical protein